MRSSTAFASVFLALGVADVLALDLVIAPAALSGPSTGDREQEAGDTGEGVAPPAIPIASASPAPSSRSPVDVPLDADADESAEAPTQAAAAPAPASPDAVAEADAHDTASPRPVTIRFAVDSADLGSRARADLDRVSRLLADRPGLGASVDGHADERGALEHNEELSGRRAEVVAEYLAGRGVEPARLSVQAYGEERPVDPGSGRHADRRNRRVEIHFAPQGDSP
jgi:outer membrane protein OmpA-like peptidoglycan-associated protein